MSKNQRYHPDQTIRNHTREVRRVKPADREVLVHIIYEETIVHLAVVDDVVIKVTEPNDFTPPHYNDTLELLIENAAAKKVAIDFGNHFKMAGEGLRIPEGNFGSVKFRFSGQYWVEAARCVTYQQ